MLLEQQDILVQQALQVRQVYKELLVLQARLAYKEQLELLAPRD